MIITAIDFPQSSLRNSSDDDELLEFAGHAGLLSTLLLRIPTGFTYDESSIGLLTALSNLRVCSGTGFTVDDDEIVTKLLDNGLNVGYFIIDEDKQLLSKVLKSLPRSRIGIYCKDENLTIENMTSVVNEYSELVGHFTFNSSTAIEASHLRAAKDLISSAGFSIQICFELPVGTPEATVVSYGTYTEGVHVTLPVRIRDDATNTQKILHNPYAIKSNSTTTATTTATAEDPDLVSVFVGSLRSDRPDGLYTTVVCDEHGICLGLVYSNELSIRTAVLERRGVYWSRSRSGLWRKGDTSGMHQDLIDIKVDCDYDAIRFTVIQRGDPPAFCHLMTRTCWGHVTGIKKLETILFDRKKAAPTGSYTKRLFDDPDLLRKKLLEEVQELVEAEEPDHVAAEAADVLYFTMTRCIASGVGLREIEDHLDKRTYKVTRRPGNAKEWRTQAAENILKEGEEKNKK